MRAIVFFLVASMAAPLSLADTASVVIERAKYEDSLRALWLGESIANWTGLRTEKVRKDPPFFTDADWGTPQGGKGKNIEFDIRDPWGADDDTDIEYVYLHLLAKHDTTTLSPEQIAAGWIRHINRKIWVSNYRARQLMGEGVLPPETGQSPRNDRSLYIDAQLTTELFGALAPGIPEKAIAMADLPIRTTAEGFAYDAAVFHVVLHSLIPYVDQTRSPGDQVIWLATNARQFIPDSSKTADVFDFVLNDFLNNPNKDDWEATRDRYALRYQENASQNGFEYLDFFESSINFASSVLCLLYGEGDYRKTVRIGTLSGWDSDNPTASIAGVIAQLIGYDKLLAEFPGESLSDRYWAARTRDEMPDYLPNDPDADDSFTLIARRMLPIVDKAVLESGGEVTPDSWLLPRFRPLPTVSAGRIEAESMFRVLHSEDAAEYAQASGGKVASMRFAGAAPGRLSARFGGETGSYSVTVRYVDEPRGASTFVLSVDGGQRRYWKADDTRGRDAWAFRDFTTVLDLRDGQVVEIQAFQHGAEMARVDYLEIGERQVAGRSK